MPVLSVAGKGYVQDVFAKVGAGADVACWAGWMLPDLLLAVAGSGRALFMCLPCACPQDDGVSDWSGVAAVLCGQKDMATAISELLTGKGVPKERILTNF